MITEKLTRKDLPALEARRICNACVHEEFLKDEITRADTIAECSYCKEQNPTMLLGELANRFETAIDTLYSCIYNGEVSSWDAETIHAGGKRFGWGSKVLRIENLIASVARIKPEPAEEVRRVMNIRYGGSDPGPGADYTAFEKGSEYFRKAPTSDGLRALWSSFERSLQTETRHFNHFAEDKLGSLFEDLEHHKTLDGRSVIVTAGPAAPISALFRARLFHYEGALAIALEKPELNLGPPPRPQRSGRMNARGISLFYGATAVDTALAEVRPSVGGRVLTGCFELVRPIRLLDIEALRSLYVLGSVLDPKYIARLRKALFLGDLSQRIIQPVMPDDEADEYLITQAIADYLANRTHPEIDGLIYPSVQHRGGGSNVALFHKSSLVEAPKISRDTRVEVHMRDLERGVDDYRVVEILPRFPSLAESDEVDEPEACSSGTRKVTLRLNRESLQVHYVHSLAVGKDTFDVWRELRPGEPFGKKSRGRW